MPLFRHCRPVKSLARVYCSIVLINNLSRCYLSLCLCRSPRQGLVGNCKPDWVTFPDYNEKAYYLIMKLLIFSEQLVMAEEQGDVGRMRR